MNENPTYVTEARESLSKAIGDLNRAAKAVEHANDRLLCKAEKHAPLADVPGWLNPRTVDDVCAVTVNSSVSEVRIQFKHVGPHVTSDVRDWLRSIVGAGNAQ